MKMWIKEYGVRFKTGTPVTFSYVRNTRSSPYLGSTYQQDIEPTGVYMLHNPEPGDLPRGWEAGITVMYSPLVIAFNTEPGQLYTDTSWKSVLARKYAARGKPLSRRLMRAGYDGIITVMLDKSGSPLDTREIVLLRA